jgi:hypothetical protein
MKQLPTIMKVVGIRTKEDMVIDKVPPHKLFPASESCDSFTSSEDGESGDEEAHKGRDKWSVESQKGQSKQTQESRQEGGNAVGIEKHDGKRHNEDDTMSMDSLKEPNSGNESEFVKYQGNFGKEVDIHKTKEHKGEVGAGIHKAEKHRGELGTDVYKAEKHRGEVETDVYKAEKHKVGKESGGAQEKICDIADENDNSSIKTRSEDSVLANQTERKNCSVADSEENPNSNCNCDKEVDVKEPKDNKSGSSVLVEKNGGDFDQENTANIP